MCLVVNITLFNPLKIPIEKVLLLALFYKLENKGE